jgi:hypothetical protein
MHTKLINVIQEQAFTPKMHADIVYYYYFLLDLHYVCTTSYLTFIMCVLLPT